MRSQNIDKQKDANNEAEYEESSVTDEVPICFNIFKLGKDILNRIDMTYERACMATQEDEYYHIMIITRYHCQMRNFEKYSIRSWKKRKRKNETPNITPIT